MRKLSFLSALAMLAPTVALAHDTGAPHLHPHGIGVVLAGMAIVFAGFYFYKSENNGLQKSKQDSDRLD